MTWKTLLKQSQITPAALLQQLNLPLSMLDDLQIGDKLFPLQATPGFIARMEKGNPNDPLLLQILPLGAEALNPPGFVDDPLDEQSQNPLPGLLHKYNGRVLLITSGACAINCRYCFRRNFPYADNNPGRIGWQAVLDYIRQDTSIHEVILSGGDPLTLTDSSLQNLLSGLEAISHIQTLRIHSRIPIVLPERINSHFGHIFKNTRLNKVMVIHANHPNELDHSVHEALMMLKSLGFHLLNQSVLLKKINDSANVQIALQHKLFAFGVLPYYLHLLDPVKGAAHFETPVKVAQALVQELSKHLPGYLVPKLVKELPGNASKTRLG